jgi:LacI family transcriptional regulator
MFWNTENEMTTLSSSPAATAESLRARPTMRDVAALAGVSLKTVSRVVNREEGVSEDLAAKVERAAAQLDYRPNLTASNLRRSDRKTATWGLLLEDVANPFSSAVHRGVEEVARELGVAVFAASMDEDPDRERELVATFSSRRVDALIIAPTATEHAYLANEVRNGIAVVFVDRPALGIDADCVVTDNRLSASAATRHLIEHGHKRIAFVGDFASITTANERYLGYIDAMAAAGVQVHPELVIRDVHDPAQSAIAVHSLLQLPTPPTAIFTAQNLITMGAVEALRAEGSQHRVALVGFDDFAMANLLDPAVTVVAQDPRAIGRLAATLVNERLANSSAPIGVHVVPSMLIARGSGEIAPSA